MAKKKKIQVIVKDPDERIGHIEEIENSLSAFQAKVGGYIEHTTIMNSTGVNAELICNEEGLLMNLPRQCNLPFVGTIFIVGIDGEDFTDCPLSLEFWARYFLKERV